MGERRNGLTLGGRKEGRGKGGGKGRRHNTWVRYCSEEKRGKLRGGTVRRKYFELEAGSGREEETGG